jgi:hypothetical protein
VGIWFLELTTTVGIVGPEIMCGNGIMPGVDFVGPRIEPMFPRATKGLVSVEVGCPPIGVLVRIVGVLVGIVGMFVGIVGIGIEVMSAGGFIIDPPEPIDRRARPSSGSTEIDAFLLDRRRVARRWLCSLCGFIVFFS